MSKINGIDVSEPVSSATNNNIAYSQKAVDELLNNIKRLQEENEKQKEQIKQLEDFIKSDGEIDHINHEYTYKLRKENEELKANKGRCAFKCLDNTFCDEAKIRIDELELNKDCLKVSLETARKYRDIAESDRNKYKQALEEIREQYVNKAFFICDKAEEECPCHNCIILGQLDRAQNIIKIIDEVLK